jgi:hypothetical protein
MATSLSSFQNMELGSFTPHCILRNYELGFRWVMCNLLNICLQALDTVS